MTNTQQCNDDNTQQRSQIRNNAMMITPNNDHKYATMQWW